MKRNVLAAAFSALLPGTGQLYNHHWLKGIGFLSAVMIISGVMRRRTLLADPSLLAMVLVVALFAILAWSVVDAYKADRTSD